MSVPDKVSYFSRFTMKFLEICAASIATAVGGYLVAHVGGYLPWPTRELAPTPAAIQAVPSGSGVVSKTSRAQPPQPPHPVPPASADAEEPRPAAAPDAGPAAKRAVRTNAIQGAPSHRPITADTDAPEGKPHEAESVEAQVRAALEKVDAHRPASPDVGPQTVSLPPAPPTAAAEPRPAESPVLGTAGAVAVTPPAAEAVVVAPPAAAAAVVTPPAAEAAREPVQQVPVQPEPLTPVEIKSLPVASVEASPPPEPAPSAHEEDKGILSTLKKIPEMFRPTSGAVSADPPRPPLPVGQ
jgi:hypothetical protein